MNMPTHEQIVEETHSEYLEILQAAQLNLWNALEHIAEPTLFRIDLDTYDLIHWIESTMPELPWTTCSHCRQTIHEWGNVAVAREDGSLVSVLFPNVAFTDEEEHAPTDWYGSLRDFITEDDEGLPRRIMSVLLRPTDGGSYPKSLRGIKHDHLSILYTPRRNVSTRVLAKFNKRVLDNVIHIQGKKEISPAAIGEAIDYHAVHYILSDECVKFLMVAQNLHELLVVAPTYRHRYNLLFSALATTPEYDNVNPEWIDAISLFSETYDPSYLYSGLDCQPLPGIQP